MAPASLTTTKTGNPLTNFKAPEWPISERLEAIRLSNDGMSLSFIGEKFNRSRGSVAGLIHRARKKGLIKARVVKLKETKKRQPQECNVQLRVAPAEIKGRIRLRLVENTEVTLLELERHHCRYPLGDPRRSDFRFCGCNKIVGSPYCESHTVITGQKPYQRRA